MINSFKKISLFPSFDGGFGQDHAKFSGRGAIIAGSLVINILGLAFPLFMLQVYDRILPFRSYETLFVMAFGVFVAILFEAYLRYYRAEISTLFASKFEHNAMLVLLDKNFSRPLSEAEKIGPGRLMEGFQAISILKSYYSGQNFQQLLDFPFVVIYVAIAAAISPVIGLTIVMGYICFFIASRIWLRSFPLTVAKYQELEARRTNFLTENFKNSHTLKSLSMESTMMRRYERLAKASAELHAKITYLIEMSSNIGVTFSALLSATAIALGAYLSIEGRITNGELAAIILLTLRCAAPVQKFGGVFARHIQDAALNESLKGDMIIKERLTATPDQSFGGSPLLVQNTKRSLVDVVLKGVSFRYDTAKQDVLLDCDFKFRAGDLVVLAGSSGSGRSTVLDLIAGFIEPSTGEVEISQSADIGKTLTDGPARVAYLSSTSEFFNGTLFDNASVFRNADFERIDLLAQKLGADKIISRLPFGWNTGVGDKVVEALPPGWVQHLLAVRVFSSDAEIVLIDNATNNFDVSQERIFINFLQALKGKATIILVSDRIVYQDLADKICVISDGQLKYLGHSVADGVSNSNLPLLLRVPLSRPVEQAHLAFYTADQRSLIVDRIAPVFNQVFKRQNDLSICFPALLDALDFKGSTRDVLEALPYFVDDLTLDEFNNSMARLGFRVEERWGNISQVDGRLLPCVFVPKDQAAFVIRSRSGAVFVSDGQSERLISELPRSTQEGTIFRYHEEPASDARAQNWVSSIFRRFSGFLPALVLIGLLHGGLALASPLFLIVVYGNVIPSGSLIFLGEVYVGVALAVGLGLIALRQKAAILSYISGRVDYLMSTSILNRVFMMPPAYTERATIGAQYARLKGFEGLRDVFHGPIGSIVSEAPTTLVISTALFIINPLAAAIFVIAVMLYFFSYKFMSRKVSEAVELSGRAAAARNEFLIETIFKTRSIREVGCEAVWRERMRNISAFAVDASLKAATLTALNYSVGYVIMMTAGLAIVSITIPTVWDGAASSAILIVSMTLMWRVLNPAQAVFSNLTRVEGLTAAKRQIDALMQVPLERTVFSSASNNLNLKGAIEFSKVSFRHSPQADPSLLGVDLTIAPGEIIGIAGANGAGKSTLMTLILGMYRPQAGSIMFDGVDSRQLDPVAIRRQIGYSPQSVQMFRATILQNLMFSRPDASQEEVWTALEMAGAADGVRKLSEGLGHRLGDGRNELPASLLRQLSLARSYLTDAPLLLLDEPTEGLAEGSETLFLNVLDGLRGKKTVLFSSHKVNQLLKADKVILLDKGVVRAFAPPRDIFKNASARNPDDA